MIYVYLIGFSMIFGYYNAWQWTDEQDGVLDPKRAKRRWKGASVLLRCWAAASAPLFHLVAFDWINFVLAGAISAPMFDITTNKVKGMSVFYLGTTSKTDLWGKWKWIGYSVFLAIAITIKIAS